MDEELPEDKKKLEELGKKLFKDDKPHSKAEIVMKLETAKKTAQEGLKKTENLEAVLKAFNEAIDVVLKENLETSQG